MVLIATAVYRRVEQPARLHFLSSRPEDGLVTFRSSSEKNVYAGPVVVGDGGSNRNRCMT